MAGQGVTRSGLTAQPQFLGAGSLLSPSPASSPSPAKPQLAKLSVGPGGLIYKQQGDLGPSGGGGSLKVLGGAAASVSTTPGASGAQGGVNVDVGPRGGVYKQVTEARDDGGATSSMAVLGGPAAARLVK